MSLREHLEQLAEQGIRHEKLDGLHIPPGAEYLWRDFCDIREGWSGGGMGPSRIPAGEFRDWAEMKGIALLPWEFEVLRAMDVAFVRFQAERNQENSS